MSFAMEHSLEPSLYTIKAIFILDNNGKRILARYYDDTYPTAKEQKAFEKNTFTKTKKSDSEIALLEGLTIVYKSNVDLYFYVVGSSLENELILMSVLSCLYDSVSMLLRKHVEKHSLMRNLDSVFLVVDEIVDGGVIMQVDGNAVMNRVVTRGDDIPLGEQTISQVFQTAKDQLKWTLLK